MTAEELVAFAEGLARIAAGGGGAKALANHLAHAAGVDVLVEDASWRHVATAGTGSAMPSSVRSLLDEPRHGETLRRMRDGRPGRTLVVTAADTPLGYLSVFGSGHLDALEHAIRLTGAAIGVEMARESGGTRGRRRTFWERLAAHAYHDLAAARDDAAARSIVLAPQYLAVVLELEAAGEAAATDRAALRAAAADAFRNAEADLGIVERANALLLFVPAQREVDAANARTAAALLARTLAKKQPHLRVCGGSGTAAPAISVAHSIGEAEAAATVARRIFGGGRVCAYEELGAYSLLLRGCDSAGLRAFSTGVLEPLRAYDEKHQTELERTLKLYFAVGENVKTAASTLNVHRHTVFYRLRQINEICKRSLDSPHDQLTLRMALAIDALND